MNDILVSVLLPTRKRTHLAYRSIDSLLTLSSDPSCVEIITAYDDDDIDSRNYFKNTEWQELIQHYNAHNQNLQCPRWGYQGLNKYYTTMAQKAHGRWLMIWNDDAVMLSRGWDERIKDNADFVGMMHMTTTNFKPNLTLFPLIPKIWLDLFGAISLHQLNDSWIQDICHEAGAVCEIPVNVFHDRFDVTGNNLDTTYENRSYNKKLYNHETMKEVRSRWAQHLKHYREQTSACAPTLLQI